MDGLLKEYEAGYDKTSKAVVLEDCIMWKGKPITAGSQILDGFISPFNAAVVEKLEQAGIPIIGGTAMDEFGIDRVDSDNPETVLGAVETVASGLAAYALCNDVFGKARRQAPSKGLCYIKPTYGTVSRYGLVPAVSSMDQIGVMCANPADGFALLSVLAGNDKRDGAMFPEASYAYVPHTGKIRLAIPDNVWADDESGKETVSRLESKFDTTHIELDYFELYQQVMYILGCAEICNNTNRYDGVKFGYRARNYSGVNDLYINTRSEALGRETKLAAIMGALVLSQDNYEPYYEKAMKIRRLIKNSVNFGEYDVIALPTRRGGTPYEQLALYALAVLAGLPSLSIPFGNDGIQLIAGVKNENVLFGAWEVAKP